MAITTKFTCDKCGAAHESEGERNGNFARIDLSVTWTTQNSYDVKYSVLWCRDCLEKFGFIRSKSPTNIYQPKPSVEDKIIEVLNELGFTQSE